MLDDSIWVMDDPPCELSNEQRKRIREWYKSWEEEMINGTVIMNPKWKQEETSKAQMSDFLKGGNWQRGNKICGISGILEEVEDDELPERWVKIIRMEVTRRMAKSNYGFGIWKIWQ